MKCPACGITQEVSFEMCPKCGVIVNKFIQRQEIKRQVELEEKQKADTERIRNKITQRQTVNQKPSHQMGLKESVKKTSRATWIMAVFCTMLLSMCAMALTNTSKYEPSKPSEQLWSESINIDITRTLVANHITGCGYLQWQPGSSNHEYIVKCSRDNQNWTTYQVWTAINAVNIYGK